MVAEHRAETNPVSRVQYMIYQPAGLEGSSRGIVIWPVARGPSTLATRLLSCQTKLRLWCLATIDLSAGKAHHGEYGASIPVLTH